MFICLCYGGYADICENPDACYHSGKQHLLEGNYSNSVVFFDTFLSIHPDNATVLNNLGIAYLRMKNCTYAEKLFDLASKDPLVAPLALQNKGLSLLCQGRTDEAEEVYTTLLDLNNSDSVSRYQRGIINYEKGDLPKAADDLQQASVLNPDDVEIQRAYATVLASLGKHDEGISLLEEIINHSPDDDLAWYNKAVILERKGEFKRAVQAYNSSIQIRPENHKAWFNMGIIFWNHYMLNESLSALNNVISLEPNMSEAWFFRGLVLKQKEDYKEATQSFENASRLSPGNEIYSAYLKKYSGIHQYAMNNEEKNLPFQYRKWQIVIPVCLVLGSWIFVIFLLRKKIR